MTTVKCRNCKAIVSSKSQHDWNCCVCYPDNAGHGFYLDGGDEYIHCGGNFEDMEWVLPPIRGVINDNM